MIDICDFWHVYMKSDVTVKSDHGHVLLHVRQKALPFVTKLQSSEQTSSKGGTLGGTPLAGTGSVLAGCSLSSKSPVRPQHTTAKRHRMSRIVYAAVAVLAVLSSLQPGGMELDHCNRPSSTVPDLWTWRPWVLSQP